MPPCSHGKKFQNSLGLLENLENLLGLFLMRSDIFSRLLKWRALHHYHNVHKILKSLILTALRKLSNHTRKVTFDLKLQKSKKILNLRNIDVVFASVCPVSSVKKLKVFFAFLANLRCLKSHDYPHNCAFWTYNLKHEKNIGFQLYFRKDLISRTDFK